MSNWLEKDYSLLSSLSAESIINAQQLEKCGQNPILILSDFEGQSLAQFIKQRSLNLAEFLEIGIQLTSALAEVHHHGIIHQNIQPNSILINPASLKLKIIDLSLAIKGTAVAKIRSKAMSGLDTAYIAPEQTGRMNIPLDYRADFYSLGILFYRLIVGVLPYKATGFLELIHCHLAQTPIAPHHLNSEIAETISLLIVKLLAKNPDDRYQSATAIAADLQNCQTQYQDRGTIAKFDLGRLDLQSQFHISNKLYGRSQAFKAIADSLTEMELKVPELLLLVGDSGIGKTTLVHQVVPTVLDGNGYFIYGKFTSIASDTPYQAIIQALQRLIQQLLIEPTESRQLWQQKTMAAVGNNGKVITSILPELELIIGSQPEIPDLPSIERQNLFNSVFCQFIRVFAQSQSPLILFLDDLQWADPDSLSLIELLLTDSELQHLRIVGAYRPNQVDKHHYLAQTLENIAQTVQINRLELMALTITEINSLLLDTLSCQSSKSLPLAELLFKRTSGNPLFLHLLLQTFYQEKLLRYNFFTHSWQWRLDEIIATPIANFNILELVCRNIERLPLSCQKILKLAACLGNQFDFSNLVDVWQATAKYISDSTVPSDLFSSHEVLQDAITQELNYALKAGIIIFGHESSTITYQFLHNHVYQTFYSLLKPEELVQLHLAIGKFLLQQTSATEIEEKIFELVRHLNIARALLNNSSEKNRLVELNLLAGQKAKTANAYEVAASYLDIALSLLPSNGWQNNYQLMSAVFLEAAEVQYLQGNFVYAEQLGNIVLSQAKTILDRIPIYKTRIRTHIAQNHMQQAVDLGLHVLKLLDISLPNNYTQDWEYTLRLDIDSQNLESLRSLPVMEDNFSIRAMEVLSIVIPPIYIVKPELFPVVVSKMIDLCLQHGNSPLSAYAYALYALLLCAADNIETGYQLGKFALELQAKFDAKETRSKVSFLFNNMVRHWREPAASTLEHFLVGIKDGVEVGDLEYACFQAKYYCTYLLLVGETLSVAEFKSRQQIEMIAHLQQDFQLNYARIWQQLNLNLQGKAKDKLLLVGESFDETKILSCWQEANNATSLFAYYLAKIILCYLFQDYDQALAYTHQGKQYLSAAVGTMCFSEYCFYSCLTMLAVHPVRVGSDLDTLPEEIISHQQQIKLWAGYAPHNYQHKYELITAETFRVCGKNELAALHYDRAISEADKAGYQHQSALAKELAGEFYLSQGSERIASYYLTDAYQAYAHWGALSKIQELESKHPSHLNDLSQAELTKNQSQAIIEHDDEEYISCSNIANLDLFSVVKASQAISSEIILDNLLSKMMAIVLENAGAQKGVLLLANSWEQNNDWLVAASAFIDSSVKVELPYVSLSTYEDLPGSIINYIQSTQQTVILERADRENMFANDLYIAKYLPQSILCAPMIYQNQLQGIMYLENSSIAGAFTEQKSEVLQALLAQVSISIANARLYKDLEDHASVQKSLRQKEILLKEIHHRVKNNLFVVSSLLDFQSNYVEDPEVNKLLENCQNRITAMAMVHQHLYGNSELDRINFAQYIKSLLDNLAYSQGSEERNINLILDLEQIELNIESANPCGLIVNELISNALEHGFRDRHSGNIWLKLQYIDHSHIMLTIEDDGVGFKEGLDLHNSDSLGLELVCTLVEQLDGEIKLDQTQGTKIEIIFDELNYGNRI
ncbi:MAG: AAA family ATPase [Cyanobacteria bacterium J06600_6]